MKRIKDITKRETIGGLLREKRDATNMSQKELSKAVGLSRSYISLIEQGERIPTYNTAIKMAECLNLKLEELFQDPNGDGNQDTRLEFLLAKLLRSGDKEKLKELILFVESLQ